MVICNKNGNGNGNKNIISTIENKNKNFIFFSSEISDGWPRSVEPNLSTLAKKKNVPPQKYSAYTKCQ